MENVLYKTGMRSIFPSRLILCSSLGECHGLVTRKRAQIFTLTHQMWVFDNRCFNQFDTGSPFCVYLEQEIKYGFNHISVIMCNKVDERVLICLLYEWKLGSSTRTSYENLIRVYGPGAIAEATVARWYARFRRGRQDLKRKTNIGVSRVLDDDELEQTVKENPELTIAELAKRFGVDVTTIRRHLKGISKGKKMTFMDFEKREQRKVNYHLNHISVIMCNKVDERVLICLLYEWKLGSSMKTSYANLIRVYGPGAIGETTVARWYVRFRRGRQDLKRKTNIGVSRVLDDNELEEVVKKDPEITTGELARRFGVDVTTIRRHLKGISKGKKMTFVDFDKREQREIKYDFNNVSVIMCNKVDERVLICLLYEWKLGSGTRTAYENLNRAYGQGAIAETTVFRYYAKFRSGNLDLRRKTNNGVSRVLDDDELEEFVKKNPELNSVELAKIFGVGVTTMWSHLKRISQGRKMKFIEFKKREEPIAAELLIPGAIPQRENSRSVDLPDEDGAKQMEPEEEPNAAEQSTTPEDAEMSRNVRAVGLMQEDCGDKCGESSVIMFKELDERVLICMLYEWKLGSGTRTAYENLIRVYGPGAITEATVARWYGKFRSGNLDLNRKTNNGVSRVLDDDELEEFVKKNPELNSVKLAKIFGVSVTTIWLHLRGISEGRKMKFIGYKKREEPIAAELLIPGAIPQRENFRSVNLPANQMEPEEEPNAAEQSTTSEDTEMLRNVRAAGTHARGLW
ncbi:hypothetical protein GCK32_012956 [Trichostrongylus colubriformis]|uniref:Mos1 transposase HTH domain-containing protein n=1 Tax=Trichostrongylus colubriformis TaxID=6319 RepID=A0AAN8IK15_TRICO